MKVINASVQELVQEPGIEGIYKHIERCGRTCYKSEDKITEDSARKFVEGLISRKHFAMLEHGTAYLRIPFEGDEHLQEHLVKVMGSPYSRVNPGDHGNFWVTTNMRVLVENCSECYQEILEKYALEEPDINHIKRVTALWIISRGIANEFVRHRVFSFAQESTRYCNYSRDKFGGEVTIVAPEWYKEPGNLERRIWWERAMANAERDYLNMLMLGLKPQEARGVLPLDLKTELVMTGSLDQWQSFLEQRYYETTGPAHPDAKAVTKLWIDYDKRRS